MNGQPIEDATNDLEDSGFEDEADDDSIYSDDEVLSGATLHAPLNLRCKVLLLRLHHRFLCGSPSDDMTNGMRCSLSYENASFVSIICCSEHVWLHQVTCQYWQKPALMLL